MKAPKDESWRLRYLRILTGPAAEKKDSQEDLRAIEDLIEEKLIRGESVKDSEGRVDAAALLRGTDGLAVPTLKGRLFIEEQQAILRSKTLMGRIKASWPLFSGIVGVIVGWVLSSWHPFAEQQQYVSVHQRDSADRPASQQKAVAAQPTKATPSGATPVRQTTPKPETTKSN